MKKILIIMSIITVFIILVVCNAYAANITLRWDANSETDLAGYNLYYKTDTPGAPYDGTGADQGPSKVNIPLNILEYESNPKFTLTGLDAAYIYFLVLTAYDNSNNESGYSNEVNTLSTDGEESGSSGGCFILAIGK